MILGDSHTFRNDNGTNHLENIAKRLEILLNTEAALEGLHTSFQVLDLVFPNLQDDPPYYYPPFLAPDLVKKYDVDEMLLCLNAETNDSNLSPFHQRPLDSEDVPKWDKDAEFLLTPQEKRIPRGRIGDFLKRHMTKNGPKQYYLDLNFENVVHNPKDLEDVAYMFSRPVIKLRKEAERLRTKAGQPVPVRLLFFSTGPSGLNTEVEPYRSLWKNVAAQAGVSFGDLTDPFLALRPDYFPVAENFPTYHATADGYFLKSLLLSDLLIKEKWIPFQVPTPTATPSKQK